MAEVMRLLSTGRDNTQDASDTAAHGRPHSLNLTIPPLATLILKPAGAVDSEA